MSMARTPIGKFGGGMSALSGPKLGAIAVREAVARAEGTSSGSFCSTLTGIVPTMDGGVSPASPPATAGRTLHLVRVLQGSLRRGC